MIDVKIEYTVKGLAGSIDIFADNEVLEIKRGKAAGLEVYQLFAYLDMGNIEIGYLFLKSFATSAYSDPQHICDTISKKNPISNAR